MTDQSPANFAEASSKLKSYDPSSFLGHIAWYSIPEMKGDYQTIVNDLKARGLDKILLPSPPRIVDVFRRACTAAHRSNIQDRDPSIRHHFTIEEVGYDKDKIYKKVVRKTVDRDDHDLGWTVEYEIEFTRVTSRIFVRQVAFGPDHHAASEEVVAAVSENFRDLAGSLHATALRDLLRRFFGGLHATTVRPSGGVFFVMQEKAHFLLQLEEVVNSWPGGCTMHTLPLLDDGKQREMVREAFRDETLGELEKELAEMRALTVKGDVPGSKLVEKGVRYREIMKRVVEFKALLGDLGDEVDAHLELFQEAMLGMTDAVED